MSDRPDAPDAIDTLSRSRGPGELHAAILALLLPDSQRASRAFELETQGNARAPAMREAVAALPPAARLPWLERLVDTMSLHSNADRQALLESTRRLMGARGGTQPIDRLHWLAMRQRLGSRPTFGAGTADADLTKFLDAAVLSAATFAAHLARIVPSEDETEGRAWFDAATAPWKVRFLIGAMPSPDGDALVEALQGVQSLGWMQRPVLARHWVDAAVAASPEGVLRDPCADALRMTCALIDSPLPPALERHYATAAASLPR